ncbi:uncharacterized protein LOC113933042 isoform X2 [Zalophus californianus]|uniref:Uncharacterized protein LOC113933042 isoform X2 n=1 Tax=Zalophus californianus TaxID=9704 RepID=A0A6P9F976_ZALCA|nr:uncharacterized protein LOC113933042 isoform X2 [Zalophus californianus]
MVMNRDGRTEQLMKMKLQAPHLPSPCECWELWDVQSSQRKPGYHQEAFLCVQYSDSTLPYLTQCSSRYQESKLKPEFFSGLGGGGKNCPRLGREWSQAAEPSPARISSLRGISTVARCYRTDPTHPEIQGSAGHGAVRQMLFPWQEVGGARLIKMQKLKKLEAPAD